MNIRPSAIYIEISSQMLASVSTKSSCAKHVIYHRSWYMTVHCDVRTTPSISFYKTLKVLQGNLFHAMQLLEFLVLPSVVSL
jgi:hypothetical protein